MFQTTQIPVGGFDSNFSYLLVCGSDALIVDPCGDVSAIRRASVSCFCVNSSFSLPASQAN